MLSIVNQVVANVSLPIFVFADITNSQINLSHGVFLLHQILR
jgi:hypothetical protein